jgi:hypothetical protein
MGRHTENANNPERGTRKNLPGEMLTSHKRSHNFAKGWSG